MALWDTNPPTDAGCPLVAGWKIIVEWCAPWQTRPRSYGDLTYGELSYGSTEQQPAQWYDITRSVSFSDITAGAVSGENWRVPVDSCSIEIVDETGVVVQIPDTDPTDVDKLAVGCRLRIGVRSPAGTYHPLFTGRVETIEDVHDRPPRTVSVEAYGHTMDLNFAVTVTRPAESARTRLNALLAANTYWDWAPFDYTNVVGSDPSLLALPSGSVQIREAMNTTSISAGWSIDTTARGAPRVQPWPLPVTTPIAHFTDCADLPGAVPSTSQTYVSDMSELINAVTLTNTIPTTVTATDPPSAFRHGVRTDGLGLPPPTVYTATGGEMTTIGNAIVARYKAGTDRCSAVVVYTDDTTDQAVFDQLIPLRRGSTVIVDRFEAAPVRVQAVVCGFSMQLALDTWTFTLALTGSTVAGVPVHADGIWDESTWDNATWWL